MNEQQEANSISGSKSSGTPGQDTATSYAKVTGFYTKPMIAKLYEIIVNNWKVLLNFEDNQKKAIRDENEHLNNIITFCYTHFIEQIQNLGISAIESSLNIPYRGMIGRAMRYFGQLFSTAYQATGRNAQEAQAALCKLLRYYTGASRDARLPQQLSFQDSGGADDQMRSESARVHTFGTSVSPKLARSMAAAGLFLTDRGGRVRCAFCQGELEAASLADGESPMRLHATRFATCPFVLGMDVGNKADVEAEQEEVKVSQPCSEDATSQVAAQVPPEPQTDAEWRSLALSDGGASSRSNDEMSEAELLASISQLSLPPPQTLRAAVEPRAAQGIEMLEREAHLLPIQHPSFINVSDRLRTLQNIELVEPADQVASAGFFLETSGLVRTLVCFACNLRLPAVFDQQPLNAWAAHATWSPRCGHLLRSRGAAFVRRARQLSVPEVVSHFPQYIRLSQKREQLQQQQASAGIPYAPNLGIRYRVEAREFRARTDIPSARLLITLGFSPAEVRTAIELRLVAVGDDFASSEQLLVAVLQQHDALTIRATDIESFKESELQRLRLSSAFGEPEESPETDWRTCKVCMVHRINIVLLDCGHLCCCSRCSASLQTCPMCRRMIRAEVHVKFQ